MLTRDFVYNQQCIMIAITVWPWQSYDFIIKQIVRSIVNVGTRVRVMLGLAFFGTEIDQDSEKELL